MYDSTTVAVGLDVHASSIRLAAVRADELLDERTLPYDEEAVERALRRGRAARCCYEAGPTGLRPLPAPGRARDRLRGGGAGAGAAAARRSGQDRPARRAQARRACSPAGCSSRSMCPRPELEAARDLVRAREDARLDRMRDRHRLSKFCLRHGRLLPTSCWAVDAAHVARRAALRAAAAEQHASTTTCTPSIWSTGGSSARAGDPRDGRAGPVARAGRPAALPARHRHADRARARRRDRRLRPLQDRRGVHGLRRPGALRAFLAASSRRQGSITKVGNAMSAGCWSRPPGQPPAPDRRLRTRAPPSAAKTPPSSSAPGAASSASTSAGSGWPAAANRTRRSSSPAPASSPASSGRSRPNNHSATPEPPTSRAWSSGCARPHGEPSKLYAAPPRR